MNRILLFIFTSFFTSFLFAVDYTLPTIVGDSATSIGRGVNGFQGSANSIFNHSSQLSYNSSYSLSGFQTKLINEYTYQNIAISKQFGKHTFAFGMMRLFVSDIPQTEEYLNTAFNEQEVTKVGSYEYRNELYKFAYSRTLNDIFSIGSSFNLFHTKLSSVTGKGINTDLSLSYKKNRNQLSLSIQNALPFLKVNYSGLIKATEDIPTQLSLALKHDINRNISLYSSLYRPTFSKKKYLKSIGTSYSPSLSYNKLELMCGYKEYYALNSIKTALGIGISLNLNFLNVSYSLEKSDFDLSNYNHFISFNFNH